MSHRKRIKNSAIITTVVLCFLLVYSSRAQSGILIDRIVATVNGEVITWSELMNVVVVEGRIYLADISESEKQKRVRELEKPFLNNIIEMRLQLQAAQKMGMSVTDSELDGAIAEIRRKYNLSDETMTESLRSENLTMPQYRKRLGDQILMQKVVNAAVRSRVVVSDKDIQDYYEANKEKFGEQEQMRIRQIFFAAPPDESQRADIEAKAEAVMQRIRGGEDFADLARMLSEDRSGKFGGDLGYISKGSILEEIEDMALSLKTGEVSRPFWGPAGLHIIKLEDRIEGGKNNGIMLKIKDILAQKEFESRYQEWITRLRESADIEIKL